MEVVRKAEGSPEEKVVAVFGMGDFFGEMALLLAEPRAASVQAVDQVTVLVLDQQTMTAGLGFDGIQGYCPVLLGQEAIGLGEAIDQLKQHGAAFDFVVGRCLRQRRWIPSLPARALKVIRNYARRDSQQPLAH